VFDTVAIVGVGLLGGSLGLDLKARGLARRVVGITRSPDTALRILERGAADECGVEMAAVADADLVILAQPVSVIEASFTEVSGLVSPEATVTDLGSTKAAIVRAGEAALGGRFVGGHPMAGSHLAGVGAARAGLFEGATWVLTPTEQTDPERLERLTGLVVALGARPVQLDIETHDLIAAAVSHMPHVAACAVALAVGDLAGGDTRYGDLAGGGLRDMTRLAASPHYLWRDILSANRGNTIVALRRLRERLDEAIAAMEDDDAIADLFARAAEARAPLVKP
jgi:prephenate dehydrogenase